MYIIRQVVYKYSFKLQKLLYNPFSKFLTPRGLLALYIKRKTMTFSKLFIKTYIYMIEKVFHGNGL